MQRRKFIKSGVLASTATSFAFEPDYSPAAIENLGKDATYEDHLWANVDFYSRVNEHIKANFPGVKTALFAYVSPPEIAVNLMAKTRSLDYYGCDGRPWSTEEGENIKKFK
ncbi:MAG: hypothetical protein ACLFUC_01055 [Bacteroidales bacterium]